MNLYAKMYPEYFALLDTKLTEFRQIESITFENSETHETRTFAVTDIKKCQTETVKHVKRVFSNIPWKDGKLIFAIELGDEISVLPERSADDIPENRNNINSVHAGAEISNTVPDRKYVEYEKPWYAVGD